MSHPEHKTIAELIDLWTRFGKTAVDGSGALAEPFLHFATGTRQEEVWLWFGEMNPCFIVGDTLQDKVVSHTPVLH